MFLQYKSHESLPLIHCSLFSIHGQQRRLFSGFFKGANVGPLSPNWGKIGWDPPLISGKKPGFPWMFL